MVITIRDIAKAIGILLLRAHFTSNCTLKVDKTKDRYEYKPLINCLKGLPKTISKFLFNYFEQKTTFGNKKWLTKHNRRPLFTKRTINTKKGSLLHSLLI